MYRKSSRPRYYPSNDPYDSCCRPSHNSAEVTENYCWHTAILDPSAWSSQELAYAALTAILRAFKTNSRFIVESIDHPTTLREYRSKTTARYNQPSRVQMYVMSPAHERLGELGAKSRLRIFSATDRLCFELVVALNFFLVLARIRYFGIKRTIMFLLHVSPSPASAAWILGLL